jgi:hypothetical protein
MSYQDGDRVARREKRGIRAATVSASYAGIYFYIIYDEGGSGWWPEKDIEPLEQASIPPQAEIAGQEWTAPDGILWHVVQDNDAQLSWEIFV